MFAPINFIQFALKTDCLIGAALSGMITSAQNVRYNDEG